MKAGRRFGRLDPRVKIVLLAVYSAALFFVDTAAGMACAALACAIALGLAGVSLRRVAALGVPAYVLAAFAVAFGSFVFATPEMVEAARAGVASGDVLASVYPLGGSEGIALSIPGALRGCLYGARIVLLVLASLAVSLATSSADLACALGCFLEPLRRLRVPVDDVAMVFSVALRFMPVTAEEFARVHDAQWARGAKFDEGSLMERLRAWSAVFVPMFVGLFRRADALAAAMEARCYGASDHRTSLHEMRMRPVDGAALVAGCALCVGVAVLL